MIYPVADRDAFKVLFAATNPHFAERISQATSRRISPSEAQRQNAEEGFRLEELVHHSVRGWAVLNGMPSAGAPGWFTPFSGNRHDALAAAEDWHEQDAARREVIERRPGSFAA
jgi:hypothetical protein